MRESTLDHWRLLSQAWTLTQEDEKAISTSTRFQVKIVRGRAQPFTSSRSQLSISNKRLRLDVPGDSLNLVQDTIWRH